MSKETLKGTIKSKLFERIAMILIGPLCAFGVGVWDDYQRGRQDSKYDQDKASYQRYMEEELQAPNLILKFFDSQFVQDFADDKVKEAEKVFMKKVLANDSTKTDFITMLGVETGLRDEVVKTKFKELFKMYVEGELITKDEAKDMINRRRINANF